jgi:2-keto-4-pentenoate hydratase/2-oxohepta-3-ene-1,7-dioic acid hydratase in catechol pathway
MKGFVNDELVSHGFMDQMDWSWGEIVAYASRGTTVLPGEAICSGTVPTGCLIEHFAVDGEEKFRGWLQPGDVVTLEVEGIGTTRQEVLPAPDVHRLRTGF